MSEPPASDAQPQPVPAWLESPPDRPVTTPPTVTKIQTLPFHDLTWENFERLCLQLARLEASVELCRRYGERGDEQAGIDLYARVAGREKYVLYQCKRVKEFGPERIRAAVDRFLEGEWAARSERFVLCTQESLAAKKRTDAVEDQAARLRAQGIAFDAWDEDELSARLKGQPDIVDGFFGEAWTHAFCFGRGLDPAAGREEYLRYLRRSLEYLDLGGIAPKVANRTVKLPMRELYVPVEAWQELDVQQAWGQTRRALALREERAGRGGSAPRDPGLAEDDLEAIADRLAHEDEQGAWQLFRERLGREQPARKPVVVKEILAQPQAVLLGHPGTGKSTTLKYVAYAIAAGLGEQIGDEALGRLPILVRLVKYTEVMSREPALSLRDFIRERHDPDRVALFRRALAAGGCLVMLDGLDEVIDPRQRAEIADQVEALVAEYPGNQYLVASRVVGYEAGRLTGDFVHFTLGALPEASIRGFVEKWYEAIEREAGAEASDEVRARAVELGTAIEERSGIRRLAENPLLLTIIALVNWKGRRLPHRRVELYRHAVETLVESWPHVRRGIEFNTEEVLGLLEPVAYRIFCARSSEEIGENDLLPLLTEGVLAIKSGVSRGAARDYAAALLPRLSEHSGLFLERGVDAETGQRMFGFMHLTFAEYLTARYLASEWDKRPDDRERRAFLAQYAHNPRWREVVLLMVAHVGLDGRRTPATRVLADLLQMDTPYDEHLHRNLLLAGDCLADDLQVEPAAAAWVIDRLAALMVETEIDPLRERIAGQARAMAGTSYGNAVLDRCLARLRDADAGVRGRAAEALGAIKCERAVDGLLDRLEDEDANVRGRAAEALGAIKSERVVDELLVRLEDEDASVRIRAAGVLGAIKSERAVDGLLDRLEDEDATVRDSAAWALGEIKSERAVDGLLARLQDESWRVRASAAWALGEIKSERSVDGLLDRLQDKDANVRRSAAWALRAIKSERSVDGLLARLRDAGADARARAAEALGPIRSERAVDGLLDRLEDEDATVRARAARALGALKSERAVDGLLTRLEDEEADVRRGAAWALGEIKNERAVDGLLDRLQDKDANVRRSAARALRAIKSERAVDELLTRLRDAGAGARFKAAWALGEIKSERAVDGLLARLQDESWRVRFSAAEALGETKNERAVDGLLARLQDENSYVRDSAVWALGALKSERAVDGLLARLENEDAEVSERAAWALGEIKSERAVDGLLARLQDTDYPDLDGKIERWCDWAYRTIEEILAQHAQEPEGAPRAAEGAGVVGPWNMG